MKFYYGVFTICVLLTFFGLACAQSDYAILVQESPAGAGVIKPGVGVHTVGINETITLTTVPNTGWKFVYWLGDVQDPTANRTKVNVNGPKIIIAVFERDEYAMLSPAGPQISVGPPGLYPNYVYSRGGEYTGGGSRRYDPPDYPPYNPPEEPENMPPPVPEEIPEPATMMLLGLGTYLISIKRKK
ncbi:MAG: PEP-CTERM sorting domain-containing protein [Phycisphaerae bacterium]